ncbi:hypothetical protein QVD17_12404 [Tagetes erecta]|uniref:Uncharacterized protein n=1 Tax=Tagetes erecta TaxID=13708 RepID=A0AAD8KVN4_TARER|nr:hypothetical protein QVD17_12404 [Tagetes erecta]
MDNYTTWHAHGETSIHEVGQSYNTMEVDVDDDDDDNGYRRMVLDSMHPSDYNPTQQDKILGRPATVDEVWAQSHGKKGTRPLDRLLRHGEGEGSKEYESLEEIDLQNNVEWVDTKAEESFRLYEEYVKEKYENDTSKRPLFDIDTMVGGKKNGRFDIRDPHVMTTVKPPMLGASNSCSTTTNEEVCDYVHFNQSFHLYSNDMFGQNLY